MDIAIITGSAGLIGGEAVEFFSPKFDLVVGVDNGMRSQFFGETASTAWRRSELERRLPNYRHHDTDIRDTEAVSRIFSEYGTDIRLVIHTAAPSPGC